jgi:hypothetical protein
MNGGDIIEAAERGLLVKELVLQNLKNVVKKYFLLKRWNVSSLRFRY